MYIKSKTKKKISRHLAKSILLEESGTPKIVKFTIFFGCVVLLAFIGWIMTMELDEMAIAPGEIVPSNHIQEIQHLHGGVISAILVKEGSKVNKGQLLIRLDKTEPETSLNQAKAQLEALLAQKERLKAFLYEKEPNFEKLNLQNSELKNDQMDILNLQRKLKEFQSKPMESSMIEMSRVNEKLVKIKEDIKRFERRITLLDIFSPVTGTVHKLNINSTGSVIASEDTILEIVSDNEILIASVKISPRDIGHIKIGSYVLMKFDTYNFARYGGLSGKLKGISITTFLNDRGEPYYKGKVALDKTHMGKTQMEYPILHGMTLQANIKTGSKTIAEYLLKPVYTSLHQSFRER